MDEEKEFIEPERIKSLIKKYCDFMPVDVLLEGETINKFFGIDYVISLLII